MTNIIITPLTLVFPENFHESKDKTVDWLSLELFFNSLWFLDFFINLNRVDFIRKIVTFRDTSYAYLMKTMIPDAIALIGSTTACIMGRMVIAKYFDIIRLIRFRKVLYPIDLFVEYYSSSGQKRIS